MAIGDSLSFEETAIIPDAVSTPWAAIETTAEVRAGDAVGVWGLGGLGTHAVQLLRLVGAAPIIAIDPLPAARRRARSLGADHALDPTSPDFVELVRANAGGRALDVALDFAGSSGVPEQALRALGRDGRLVIVGLSGRPFTVVDSAPMVASRQRILGHYGSWPRHVPQLVRLCAAGRLDLSTSISEVFPLAEAARAVRSLEDKDGQPVRLVLQP